MYAPASSDKSLSARGTSGKSWGLAVSQSWNGRGLWMSGFQLPMATLHWDQSVTSAVVRHFSQATCKPSTKPSFLNQTSRTGVNTEQPLKYQIQKPCFELTHKVLGRLHQRKMNWKLFQSYDNILCAVKESAFANPLIQKAPFMIHGQTFKTANRNFHSIKVSWRKNRKNRK